MKLMTGEQIALHGAVEGSHECGRGHSRGAKIGNGDERLAGIFFDGPDNLLARGGESEHKKKGDGKSK
jgi:hypothetical protein